MVWTWPGCNSRRRQISRQHAIKTRAVRTSLCKLGHEPLAKIGSCGFAILHSHSCTDLTAHHHGTGQSSPCHSTHGSMYPRRMVQVSVKSQSTTECGRLPRPSAPASTCSFRPRPPYPCSDIAPGQSRRAVKHRPSYLLHPATRCGGQDRDHRFSRDRQTDNRHFVVRSRASWTEAELVHTLLPSWSAALINNWVEHISSVVVSVPAVIKNPSEAP
jgi:hypothetical protein